MQLPFGFTLTRDDVKACWRLTRTRTGSELRAFCGRPYYVHRDVEIGFAYWRNGFDGDPFRLADRWGSVTFNWPARCCRGRCACSVGLRHI